jgi:hypothetical protein
MHYSVEMLILLNVRPFREKLNFYSTSVKELLAPYMGQEALLHGARSPMAYI